ncbi:cupin domain-containing protein [Lujinxingia litoralis]|nr:cupin domain-containing protein [Lujinxingia litoralis]
MDRTRQIVAVLIGALVVSAASAVIAQTRGEQAQVINARRAPERVGDEGQVRVAPLLQGAQAYMGRWVLAPNAQTEARTTEAEEYLYILEGSGVAVINGQSYIIGPEMAVFVPAGAEIRVTNGAERLVAVQVFAPADEAARFEEWRLRDDGESWPPRRRRPRVRTRQSGLDPAEPGDVSLMP